MISRESCSEGEEDTKIDAGLSDLGGFLARCLQASWALFATASVSLRMDISKRSLYRQGRLDLAHLWQIGLFSSHYAFCQVPGSKYDRSTYGSPTPIRRARQVSQARLGFPR